MGMEIFLEIKERPILLFYSILKCPNMKPFKQTVLAVNTSKERTPLTFLYLCFKKYYWTLNNIGLGTLTWLTSQNFLCIFSLFKTFTANLLVTGNLINNTALIPWIINNHCWHASLRLTALSSLCIIASFLSLNISFYVFSCHEQFRGISNYPHSICKFEQLGDFLLLLQSTHLLCWLVCLA